jgi:hypothetical protein
LRSKPLVGGALREVLGPGRAAIVPGAATPLRVADLPLESGLRPRDFLLSGADGKRAPVERFAPVRPDAVAELAIEDQRSSCVDLLVVRERCDSSGWLERYDHLLSGWWRAVPRYARTGTPPLLVVLCADAGRARECALMADRLLCATLARIGAGPLDWERPGRSRIRFADEREVHAGSLAAWQVPRHPPALRDGQPGELLRVELAPLAHAAAGVAQPPWR